MTAAVETMAYAGELPWHGLGVKVEPTLTTTEMLEAAGLDWTVSHRKCAAADDNGRYSLKSKKLFALVRDSDHSVLGPCGSKYIPTQNEQVFEFFNEFVKAGDMEMHTAGSLLDGRKVWALASLREGFTLAGGDEVHGHLLLVSPHIWGESMQALFTSVRVVCNNTLQMALSADGAGAFRMPHIREFDVDIQAEAKEAMGLGHEALERFEEQAEFLSKTRYTIEHRDHFIASLFQPKLLDPEIRAANDETPIADQFRRTAKKVSELVETQPGAELESTKGTYWGLVNAVTYFADHEAGRNRDTSLDSAWFGARSKMKQQALVLATDMAKAA